VDDPILNPTHYLLAKLAGPLFLEVRFDESSRLNIVSIEQAWNKPGKVSVGRKSAKQSKETGALTLSHFTALRRRLEVYPPRSAQKQQGRKNSHNGVPGNLLAELVHNNQPTNKDRYARNSSWPGALISTQRLIR
jgi:hypothetical protein